MGTNSHVDNSPKHIQDSILGTLKASSQRNIYVSNKPLVKRTVALRLTHTDTKIRVFYLCHPFQKVATPVVAMMH